MIPVQVLSLKHDIGDCRKYCKANAFLYDFELNKIERASIALKSHTVCRYLTAIFKERYSPRERYHTDDRPLGGHACFLKFQMPIPSKRHEDVA